MDTLSALGQTLQDCPTAMDNCNSEIISHQINNNQIDTNGNHELPIVSVPQSHSNTNQVFMSDQQSDHKVPVSRVLHVEVSRDRRSIARRDVIEYNVVSYLKQTESAWYVPVTITQFDNSFLTEHVISIHLVQSEDSEGASSVCLSQVTLQVHVYQLAEAGGNAEELEHDGEQVNASNHWSLPSAEFTGLWESLVFEHDVKQQLLNYARSALLFSDKEVNSGIISWNRVVLLHGPPGTGKTSMCKALAHKLAIRMTHRYPDGAELIEVNSHSLFSKWFSESGKLVQKMFQKIQDYVEDGRSLVFVLIDEVESLTAVRQAALSGNEPSDAIRVVNALLTQLDQLKRYPNVLVLTTSNITGAIDLAFVDRADIRQYIGPPGQSAIYAILRTCLEELMRCGFIQPGEQLMSEKVLTAMRFSDTRVSQWSLQLWQLAAASKGLSGRTLRKLPFLAHARFILSDKATLPEYLNALEMAVKSYWEERNNLTSTEIKN